jgi:hypothetical protein
MTLIAILLCTVWFATLAAIVYLNYSIAKERKNRQ